MFCPKCGNQTNDGAAFCPKCGASLSLNANNANTAPSGMASQYSNASPQGTPAETGMDIKAFYNHPANRKKHFSIRFDAIAQYVLVGIFIFVCLSAGEYALVVAGLAMLACILFAHLKLNYIGAIVAVFLELVFEVPFYFVYVGQSTSDIVAIVFAIATTISFAISLYLLNKRYRQYQQTGII